MTEKNKALMKVEGVLMMILIGLLAMFYLTGCTTTKVVTVEKIRTDTLYESKLMYDSIHIHDSIHIKEKGDSVWIERWHTKYIEKQITDTVYQSKCDSIPVPYEVIKEVPKKLSLWQTTFIWIGIIFSLALILYIIFRFKFVSLKR